MIEFKIGDKAEELKFNFKAKWKADQLFSSKDADGNSAENGAATIWLGLIYQQSDTALVSALQSMTKYSKDELIDAVEENAESAGGIGNLIDKFAEEIKKSDFFKHAATQFMKQEEKFLAILKNKKNKTEEDKANIDGLSSGIQMMKETLS